jgi:plasmid stabilization system protein ParE
VKFEIIYSKLTGGQLKGIYDYIAADNPDKAKKFVGEIMQSIKRLAVFPFAGAPIHYDEPLKRKLIFKPYVVRYRINEKLRLVTILSIRHAARRPIK